MIPEQLLSKPREPKRGRPPANPSNARFWETPLHNLLATKLAHIKGMVVEGKIVPSRLAKECKRCRFTAYRWLGESRISPGGARKIIEISDGRITKEELAPFLIL